MKEGFMNFYDKEAKKRKSFALDVSDLDRVKISQEYNKAKARQTIVITFGDLEVKITPNLDKLGVLSARVVNTQEADIEEMVG